MTFILSFFQMSLELIQEVQLSAQTQSPNFNKFKSYITLSLFLGQFAMQTTCFSLKELTFPTFICYTFRVELKKKYFCQVIIELTDIGIRVFVILAKVIFKVASVLLDSASQKEASLS